MRDDDPSGRIRTLRAAARMSQSALAAATGLSNGYISLLETGQRRPSPAALEMLAAVLGTTVTYLRDGQASPADQAAAGAVTTARAALDAGRPEEARALLMSLRLDEVSAETLLSVSEALGHAHERAGHPDQSIDAFEQALELATRTGNLQRAAKAGMQLVASRIEIGALDAAVETGERLLRDLATPDLEDTDAYLRLGATVMWALFERGDHLQASHRAAELLVIARDKGTPRGRGSILWNAALIAHARGQDAHAVDLAEQALADMLRGGTPKDIPRIRFDLAYILLRHDPPRPADALVQLELAATGLAVVGSVSEQARCTIEQARAHLLLGDDQLAEDLALRGMGQLGDTVNLDACEGHLTLGDIAAHRGDLPGAAAHYTWAADRLSMMSAGLRAAEVWADIAERLEAAGDHRGAHAAFRACLIAAHQRPSSPTPPAAVALLIGQAATATEGVALTGGP